MTTEFKDPSFSVDSALLSAVLEHVDQGILMVDANGYVAVCNSARSTCSAYLPI